MTKGLLLVSLTCAVQCKKIVLFPKISTSPDLTKIYELLFGDRLMVMSMGGEGHFPLTKCKRIWPFCESVLICTENKLIRDCGCQNWVSIFRGYDVQVFVLAWIAQA